MANRLSDMFNVTAAAEYLGISRKKFRRIAPAPEVIDDGIYPYWSRGVLDILPLEEDFTQEEVLKKGKECGCYLIGTMSPEEIRALRLSLTGTEFGGPARRHVCGIDEVFSGKVEPTPSQLIKRAKWLMAHCNCPGSSPAEETSFVLKGYGVPITFRCDREAKLFREGMLSAVKQFVISQIEKMDRRNAVNYVMSFWGGGSYEGLLLRHRAESNGTKTNP